MPSPAGRRRPRIQLNVGNGEIEIRKERTGKVEKG
jgi:hypothetical protein